MDSSNDFKFNHLIVLEFKMNISIIKTHTNSTRVFAIFRPLLTLYGFAHKYAPMNVFSAEYLVVLKQLAITEQKTGLRPF